ncbi:MAG: hypothetical protein Q9164_006144 [Protoblastenia rupestris]
MEDNGIYRPSSIQPYRLAEFLLRLLPVRSSCDAGQLALLVMQAEQSRECPSLSSSDADVKAV